jgi:hypothetical protein
MRSTNASIRRMERANQRRNREIAKAYKEQQKRKALENAASEVEIYENYLSLLTSIHKDCSEEVNWLKILNEEAPIKPISYDQNELLAKNKLNNYKPSIIDRWFKLEKKQIEKLKKKVEEAKVKDEKHLNMLVAEYEKNYSEWEKYNLLAKGVLDGKEESFLKALKEFDPFSDIDALGSFLKFNFHKNIVEVNLKINGTDVIPNESKSLTSTGKLSVKKVPVSKFNELYQDYVCGCVLRIAREMYALLPIKMVIVNAVGEILNSRNGHLEETPIVSAAIPLDTLKKLRFDTIDCSDAMKNFVCKMSFSKTNGFSGVNALKKQEIEIFNN